MREVPWGSPNVMHQPCQLCITFTDSLSHTHPSQPKAKGVERLIEISNPNRVANKAKKATDIDVNAKVELSRRER